MEQENFGMIFSSYPRKVEYWICSDMRTFPTREEAEAHERMIQSEDYRNKSYNASTSDKYTEIYF